jgi:hypothetical protein
MHTYLLIIQICSSGAHHHARFMAYSIYFLKMELLSEQFEMTDEERRGVK